MKKRPLAIFLIGSIVLVAVLIALSTGASLFLGESSVVISDKVALVKIEGIILDSEEVVGQLKDYAKNSSVKAIVLRINSPGGAVAPSQEIYAQVNKIRAEGKKKVVTSMGSVAASGGYYIASASDSIVANPGTLTGSIGVIMEFATAEELMKKIGLKSEVIKSGEKKDVGNIMRGMSEEEREYLQGVIDDVHAQFVGAVAASRGMDEEEVMKIADGSVFTGRQAREIGLVDELGGLEDAVKLAADMAGIKGEPDVISEKKGVTFMDFLRGEDIGNLLGGAGRFRLPNLFYLWASPAIG